MAFGVEGLGLRVRTCSTLCKLRVHDGDGTVLATCPAEMLEPPSNDSEEKHAAVGQPSLCG